MLAAMRLPRRLFHGSISIIVNATVPSRGRGGAACSRAASPSSSPETGGRPDVCRHNDVTTSRGAPPLSLYDRPPAAVATHQHRRPHRLTITRRMCLSRKKNREAQRCKTPLASLGSGVREAQNYMKIIWRI